MTKINKFLKLFTRIRDGLFNIPDKSVISDLLASGRFTERMGLTLNYPKIHPSRDLT